MSVEIDGVTYDHKIEFKSDKKIYQSFHPVIDGVELEDIDIEVSPNEVKVPGTYYVKIIIVTLKQTKDRVRIQAFVRDADDTTKENISEASSEHIGAKVDWTPRVIRGRYMDIVIGLNLPI
ncbi:hypothetical protein LCGC14_1919960 [marine sediment metagenome]|uniref:Uncharacterized protein n=1 Tax=marine sediment metagenome TaxID=412755 RepID=A0A0F9FQX5_9ZZZZ